MLRIREVEPLDSYWVRLTLTDGSVVERDLSSEFENGVGVFAPLGDPALFRQVRVEDGTLVWPGDVDLCPDALIWGAPPPKDPGARPARIARFAGRTLEPQTATTGR